MQRRSRPSAIASPALWLALLVLAFVWQPILLLAGEAHASAHLLERGHGHHGEHAEPGVHGDEAPASEGADPWHGLLHVAHCCGHLAALPAELPGLAPTGDPGENSSAAPGSLVTRTLPQPLRPPIRS